MSEARKPGRPAAVAEAEAMTAEEKEWEGSGAWHPSGWF